MDLSVVDHRIPLSDGNCIPIIGLATHPNPVLTSKGRCREAVKLAIDVGYQYIDGAYSYQNEDEVGEAIREKIAEGRVRREDIFYCGKLWATYFDPERVLPCLQKTLQLLHLDYVDLYVIEIPMALKVPCTKFMHFGGVPQPNLHTLVVWDPLGDVRLLATTTNVLTSSEPSHQGEAPELSICPLLPGDKIHPRDKKGNWLYHNSNLCATWEALEACKDAGLVKSLGVSDFNRRQLEQILNKPGLKYKPVCNQVECHPYFTQRKLLEFCQQHDIVIIAYTPLGISRQPGWVITYFQPLLNDELLNSLGKKYNKTATQVALRFNIQRGIVVIPKSFNPERIKENFQIFDFSLTKEEMKSIEALNKNLRLVDHHIWSDHPEYPFHDDY